MLITQVYLPVKKKIKKKKEAPRMHREKHLIDQDGHISDVVVFVNFCTLFFVANTLIFFNSCSSGHITVV